MSRLTEILEATAASHEGGFGAFARKDPRHQERKRKPEWKNPNRTKLDDVKDKARDFGRRMKKRGEENYIHPNSRKARQQAKIAQASDSAQAAIDAKTPMANKFNAQKAMGKAETQAHTANRTLKRGDYEAERRASRQQQRSQPLKLVPLQQADEAKVRQLAKRLNGKQAAQLGEFINNIIANNKAKPEGTAEQVAKRQGPKQ